MSNECEIALATLNETYESLLGNYTECGCDGADLCADSASPAVSIDVPMHIGAAFIILFCSLLGALLPVFQVKLGLPNYILLLGKHFGIGIVLACALVHMLQPAAESLTSRCLGPAFSEDYGAYAYLFATIAIFAMHGLDIALSSCIPDEEEEAAEAGPAVADNVEEATGATEATGQPCQHHHHDISKISGEQREHYQAYLLEFGFTVHSIFIGLAVGVAQNEFNELLIALVFHQFFEGLGLGSRLISPTIPFRDAIILGFIFAIAAPIGILVGTTLVTQINPDVPSFLLAQGILDAFCAGILLYVGFLMLFVDFPKDVKFASRTVNSNRRLYGRLRALGLFVSMWSGAGLMAFVGRFL